MPLYLQVINAEALIEHAIRQQLHLNVFVENSTDFKLNNKK